MSVLDDQVRDAVSRVLDSLRGRMESELGACRDEIVHAAEREIAQIREAAANQADEHRARHAAELEELHRQLNEAREDSHRRVAESLRHLEEAQSQIEAAGRDVETARTDAESARREAEVARHDADSARHDADSAREEADSARRDADSARQEADSARHEAEAARQHAEGARREAETASQELDGARRQFETTREEVEATLRDVESARRDSDAAQNEVHRLNDSLRRMEERVAQAARLPGAVRSLDDSSTFGDVLENLAQSAGREAGRAAVFLLKGDRLRDWRTVGFVLASDEPRLDIALTESGLMAEAVHSGEGVRQREGEPLPEFAGTNEARKGAAWPVSVGGSVVAVLYADGPVADNLEEPFWPVFLDVLTRHAGRVLEGITVRQAAGLMTGRHAVMSPSSAASQPSSGSMQ